MNSSQHFNIRNTYQIWKALYELTDEKYDEWDSLTKEDLLREVMARTRGSVNPEVVRKIIDEL